MSRPPMTDREFDLFFNYLISNAHTYGVDSTRVIYDMRGIIITLNKAKETKDWFMKGIRAKLKKIEKKNSDIHVTMKIVLEKLLIELA